MVLFNWSKFLVRARINFAIFRIKRFESCAFWNLVCYIALLAIVVWSLLKYVLFLAPMIPSLPSQICYLASFFFFRASLVLAFASVGTPLIVLLTHYITFRALRLSVLSCLFLLMLARAISFSDVSLTSYSFKNPKGRVSAAISARFFSCSSFVILATHLKPYLI